MRQINIEFRHHRNLSFRLKSLFHRILLNDLKDEACFRLLGFHEVIYYDDDENLFEWVL